MDVRLSEARLSLTFAAEDLAAVDAALDALESRLGMLISLRPDIQLGLARMGEKSEAFCRRTLTAMAAQPQAMVPDLDLAAAQADLAAADALHPRLVRLRRLAERAEDTELALGSDVMVAALQSHAWLEAAGCVQETVELRRYG
jgi:hypothetical protein